MSWISVKDKLPLSKKRVMYMQQWQEKGKTRLEVGIGSYDKSIKTDSRWYAWYAGLKCFMSGQKRVKFWREIPKGSKVAEYPKYAEIEGDCVLIDIVDTLPQWTIINFESAMAKYYKQSLEKNENHWNDSPVDRAFDLMPLPEPPKDVT